MKRTILFVTPIFISIFLLSFSGKNQAQTKPPALLKTLVIDAGHGGIDPGARGNFSTEADVSLDVALKFGKALEKEFPDLKIVYTRTSDVMAGNKKNLQALRNGMSNWVLLIMEHSGTRCLFMIPLLD